MDWYLAAFRKYADFKGRSRRMEYWMFVLINALIGFAVGFIDGLTGLADADSGYGPLGILFALVVVIPGLAVSIRRLHDTGRSGWWLLIGFVPILGAIALLVFFALDGDQHRNEYGLDPKQA